MIRIRRATKRKRVMELHPDEILLDAHNLPAFDKQQFEGRLERPIAKRSLNGLLTVMVIIGTLFVSRLGYLQVVRAAFYEKKSEQNSLDHTPIIADRGIIYDRNGVELAWNTIGQEGTTARSYISKEGFANLLGYVSYPAKDSNGNYWQAQTVGKDGIEQEFNSLLSGKNGTNLVETDATGAIISQNTIDAPVQGQNLTLSIDARVQSVLEQGIKNLAAQSGYIGGAGAVMDITNGELLAMTTYPEYNQYVLSQGKDAATINSYLTSDSHPFLNRMIDGLYAPGSIVKPFLSLAALHEHVITPDKVLYTTGSLSIPNPYSPGQFSVFKDNANHGAVDMKKALAVSSNVYFYEIGGGFGDQPGLGIDNIQKYMALFGIGQKTGFVESEQAGVVPSIAWKQKNFPGDPWRIGDTYHTSIGQYGFQVTPLQMVRAVAGIASRGTLVTPVIVKGAPTTVAASLPFTSAEYDAVFAGMRLAVTDGTAQSLNNDALHVAAKTGTAQVQNKTHVNSWVIGFFPYEHPRYAFVVMMDSGPLIESGAANAFKPVIDLFA
ncbi:MAG TPA: penicillin-binding transpeptidase domain-containing protein, partial [Candidatus Paceibacterota bacterium]|nr:penicillin-binding transpeptidase domain-containing protein [Candidatus Paceibacterota bacterium]